MQQMDVLEALAFCLKRGIAFYAYRLPGEKSFCFGAQLEGEVVCLDSVENLADSDGFVAVPFREDEGAAPLFIRGDVVFEGMMEEQEVLANLQQAERKKGVDVKPKKACSREDYRKQADGMIGALQQKVARKAVLARGIVVETDAYCRAPQWFESLALRYPDAFVFLVSVPGKMTWMGATPEILLKQEEREVVTMSLAGTRKVGSVGEWGGKELEEQRIVTEYIANLLQKVGEWSVEGPFTKQAGGVEHLCTVFKKNGQLSLVDVERLRRILHPTPAVGGFPLREALEIIRREEGIHRRYYAGYVGPWYRSGCFQWYVNLRSMELFPGAVRLYVGGGITALSDAEKEWEETVMKSRTLLDVIGNDL